MVHHIAASGSRPLNSIEFYLYFSGGGGGDVQLSSKSTLLLCLQRRLRSFTSHVCLYDLPMCGRDGTGQGLGTLLFLILFLTCNIFSIQLRGSESCRRP